jgi:serine protease AprX
MWTVSGLHIALPMAMLSRTLPASPRRKATWGSRFILPALIAALALPVVAEAARKPARPAAASASDAAERKLDRRLRDRARTGGGESNVIVELNDTADDSSVIRGFGRAGRKLRSFNGRVLRVSNRQLERLARNPRVKRIVEDREVTGFNGRTAITTGARAVIDLMGYTGAGVGVAVIDSGVAGYHLDLTHGNGSVPTNSLTGSDQRVTHFKDFVNDYPYAYDDWGHGTHVAGIVAGNGAMSLGRHEGMAPGASIIALKVLNGQGVGTISNIIAAIDHAIAVKDQYNIRVINMSLGAGVYESYNTDPLTLAAKRAVDAGIVVVAAAGNLGKAADGTPQYGAITAPGNAPWVLTVGASSSMGTLNREDDQIALYSSRGPTMYDYAAKPDLVAPGTGVVSLVDPGSAFYTTKAQYLVGGLLASYTQPYLSLSGTSMAAPAVAGTVALMLHANPSLTPNMVKAILQYTAQVYPDYNYLTQGAGFLNAKAAVTLAQYFGNGQPGDPYPSMNGWSKHIFWGNFRVFGGVLTPGANAWGANIVWGQNTDGEGDNIVWGQNCEGDECDNIVWGNDCEGDGCDNIVWGNSCDPNDPNCDNIVWGQDCDTDDCDNIVWGNEGDDNIVWGNDCDADGCDNIVWGNDGGDNIVWGNDCEGDDCDNIVWGNDCDEEGCDNIVWGNTDGDDNIVWGNDCEGDECDNIVWGNDCDTEECDNIVWGNSFLDFTFEEILLPTVTDYFGASVIDTFDSSTWDQLFQFSVDFLNGTILSTPTTTDVVPPQDPTIPPPTDEATTGDPTTAIPPPDTDSTSTTTTNPPSEGGLQ